MKKFIRFSISALAALTFMTAPAVAEEAKVLTDHEMADVFAGEEIQEYDGDYDMKNLFPGIQLNDYAQQNASALVLQNLNKSSSIVQVNIAVSGGGENTFIPSNVVINSQ